MKEKKLTGASALFLSLLEEGVDTIFGYPGGAIMPVYDALYDFKDKINHYLVRHEQGAVHAAEGYARACGKVGVCITTSGPGATNTVTGIADAYIDSTPLVVITGQVGSGALGTDAFQETYFTRITHPITKWNILVQSADEIPSAVAKAFYIAKSGRPGPVVIDVTKNAQQEIIDSFFYERIQDMRSYRKKPIIDNNQVERAIELINNAKRPLLIIGQGIHLSGAEEEILEFIEKTNFPVTTSLLGLSCLPSNHKNHIGMIGMHGYYAPNININKTDLIIGIGVRFDDRLISNAGQFAINAKIVHIDIDASEMGKTVETDVEVHADAKDFLNLVNDRITNRASDEWWDEFIKARAIEEEKVIQPDLNGSEEGVGMPEIIDKITKAFDSKAIVVTDVGQHQMFSARYANLDNNRSFICSGGLGTMGFGLPAAIGAKVAMPNKTICLFVGDGGIQMNIQELATIMHHNIDIKIIILNNSFLGLVRQWQEMFFEKRYSCTNMINPDYSLLARANKIEYSKISKREEVDSEIAKLVSSKGSYILEVEIIPEDNVFPMVPVGAALTDVILTGDNLKVTSKNSPSLKNKNINVDK